jgi:para-nitrobenzyl esterase
VQRNISAFGGDPSHVTIFGESAGGYSACVHYLSPVSRGLFGAVISESGICSSVLLDTPHADALATGDALATKLGCTGADRLACLRAMQATDLIGSSGFPPVVTQLPGGLFFQGSGAPTPGPNVDGVIIPKSTTDGFAAGGYPPLPILLGTNRNEGTMFTWQVISKEAMTDQDVSDALTRRFGVTNVAAILAHYPAASYTSPNLQLADIAGDAFFVCPARATARAATAAGAPVWRYTFERELNGVEVTDGGVIHGSELPFVFGFDTFPLGMIGDSASLVDAVQTYWTDFAKTGDPNGAGAPAWAKYDATDPHQVLDVPVSSGTALKKDLCDFWSTITN